MSNKKRILLAVASATLTVVLIKARHSAIEYASELAWKFGSTSALILAWLNSNVGAVAALTALVGLAVNVIFQYRRDARESRSKQ